MTDLMDLHTHTTASGHAYNTLDEMLRAAADKQLPLLGCADHTPAMPGGPHAFYFINFKVIPRCQYGVRLLMGAELNIIDSEGTVDLPDDILKTLDYTIASLHPPCIPSGSRAENTRACLKAMENPYVRIIGHPDDGRYPLDYQALASEAKKSGTILEVNNSSLNPRSFRPGAYDNYKILLSYCEKLGVPVLMGSDAHAAADVGNHSLAAALLKELSFPEELIINYSLETLARFIPKAAK